MATITPSKADVPALVKNQGVWYETATIANGDDLDLSGGEQPRMRTIAVTASDVTTALNSLTDGIYAGQCLRLLVVGANTLRVPAALSNVGAGADVDITEDAPATLVWGDASGWLVAAR